MLAISPAEVEFSIHEPGIQLSMPVCIKNLDGRLRSFRIKAPATRWFRISGIEHQHRLAPGLSVTFEVVFNGSLLEDITGPELTHGTFHDTIKIATESASTVQELPIELWLHARPPRPRLGLQGDLQFGVVPLGTKAQKQLQLRNTGTAQAEFSITWDKALPVSVSPTAGRLGAAGGPDSSSLVSVTMAPSEAGAVVGDLAISTAGQKEPMICPLGASAVQSSYQLLDDATKAPVAELNFGEIFFGENVSQTLVLVNNGPTEQAFDLSFGRLADLKTLLSSGPDEEEPSNPDDRLAAFLQVARIRAKAREDKGTMLRVSPISGVIAPYASVRLCVTFKPFAQDGAARGFKAQPLSPQQQIQPFEGLVQVNLSSGKHLRLPVKGCGMACALKLQPEVLHFGIVPSYQWADQLLQLSNGCPQLPMQLCVSASGPFFSSLPAQLELAPGGSGEVLLRYRPKAPGIHQAVVCVQVVSRTRPGLVLFEAAVPVMGSSHSLGPRQQLPGGIDATPDTFTLPMTFVDEADAAVAGLMASKTYKRPKLWEVPENADRLQGIGTQDRFAVTLEVQQARATHADQYSTFISARRTAAARKYLTQPEGGEGNANMDMQPYRGLHPPKLRLKQQVEPLWTVSQHIECMPSTQKLPPVAALAAIPTCKEWPETAQERTACSAALTTEQLSSLVVAPRQLDFAKLSSAAPGQQHFLVTNPLTSPVHVVLNLSTVEGLSCVGPCSQVVPAGSSAKFLMQLHCHDTRHVEENIQYVINGCHFQSLLVVADVVPVTLDVSEDALMFTFSLDNWDDHVEMALMLDNPHSFPVEYDWALSSPVFTVTPRTGIVKPRSSCQALVKWTPGAPGGKAAAQQPLLQPLEPPAKPAAASQQASASGPAAGPKLRKSTSSIKQLAGSVAGDAAAGEASKATSSRPLSKESSSKQAATAASQHSQSPSTEATAAGRNRRASGSQAGGLPANSSSITVELPAEPAPAAAAAAAAVGCQHTGFMTLKLKGGGDVCPKRVVLFGELPASQLKIAVKEVNVGPVPLFEQQMVLVQIKNAGSTDATFRVLPSNQLSVSPERGQVVAEGSAELEVMLLLTQPGHMSTVLELDLRAGKVLRLPIRAEGVVPQVHVQEPVLRFPSTFIGTTQVLPLTLSNTTPVTATLMCDLMQLPEFEVHLSRDAWAAAGYTSCPVKRIGANGEMSAVGSMRASRRTTTHGSASSNGASGCGFRYLISMQPSSSLPLQLVYRPSIAQAQQFVLPLTLQHGYSGSVQDAHSAASTNQQHNTPAAAVSSNAAAQRRVSPERRASAAGAGHSTPGSAAGSTKAAAAACAGQASEQPKLAVPVEAEGVVPKVILSKAALDFGSKVARRALQGGKSPYVFEVQLRNNTDTPLQVAVGPPAAVVAFQKPSSSHGVAHADASKKPGTRVDEAAASSAYAVEGWDTRPSAQFFSIGPDEDVSFVVRFSPTEARLYEACVPVFLDGDKSAPYMLVQLSGTGTLPRLTFNVAECVLPVVPLGIKSTVRVWVVNDGYDNLELTARLPPDTSRLPITVSFPEGRLIGLAKERLPLDVSCCSSKPLSFTTALDLLDEDGGAFSLAVTGGADSCSLSHGPFMQLNSDRLQLAQPSVSGYPIPLRLLDLPAYEVPMDEVVGPVHISQGVLRFLSAVTSSSWMKAARGPSKAGGSADGTSSHTGDEIAVLRQWLLSTRGKGLLELIETLGGKPVSLKGASAKPTAGSKADPVQQLLVVYEAALNHLTSQGAVLNAVKPEYLLPVADFHKLVEDRTVAAAGNPDLEDALDYCAAVETSFGAYSAMSWNCVLLQLLKVYALARVTPTAVRQLLDTIKLGSADHSPAASSAQAQATASNAPAAVRAGHAASKAAASRAPQETAGQDSGPTPVVEPVAVEPGSMPPDEVLAGSNISSTAEACLLAWMNAHVAKAFPKQGLQVTNFGPDLRDGVVLGVLLATYWPGDSSGQLLSRLHLRPVSARHLRENQERVVKALQELCLPYELSAADLDDAEPQAMVLLATYLFTALPQLLPRATLDFCCKLGEQQMREIQLSNPTRRPLSYAARLEGASDFSLEASLVKIDPGQSTQLPVKFSPSTAVPKSCRLVLMSRRDSSAASAATMVFLLKGQADVKAPLKQVSVSSCLYQLATQEFSITNPFAADCDFSISVVPVYDQKPGKDGEPKGKKDPKAQASAAAKAKTAAGAPTEQQAHHVMKLLPEPFGLDRQRLRLKAGASEKVKLSFLPFVMPANPPPAASTTRPRKAGKAATQQAQDATQAAAFVRCLLVLRDSECGEFTYELLGEVGQPGVFLQHEAKIWVDGQQAVELQVPFNNHLLENTRRTYTEKHPLGRDKQQLSRLRADIGSSNGFGERVLEFTVSCDSPFFTVPSTVVLKGCGPPQPMQDATAASSPAATSRVASSQSARKAPPLQQQAAGTAAANSREGAANTLKLGVKPVGPGVHPAKLVLTSPYDVRVIQLQVIAQARGQAGALELECPARQQVLQELPLLNSGSDVPLSATATLVGKGFSGPLEVTVAPKADGCYPLIFCPPSAGNFAGTLELLLAPTSEKLVYSLTGRAGEPLSEGHIVVECQARSEVMKRLQVPNIIGSLPLQYSVYTDADWMSGPATMACASATRGDTYKLSVCPLVSGTHWGSITFMAAEDYCWYSVEVRASEPPEQGTITASCPVHEAVSIKLPLTNPANKAIKLKAVYGCCSLLGPTAFVAPAGPCEFECFFAPLVQGREEGVLRLVSREAGEFWWKLVLNATPALPQAPVQLSAPLGSTSSHMLSVANPTTSEATFSSSSSCPDRFWIKPGTFKVPANSVAEVQLCYTPGSFLQEEKGEVSVSSATAGSYEYTCIGQGKAPSGTQTSSISCTIGQTTTSNSLSFNNPFDRPVDVEVTLSSVEAPGTFNLLLQGAATVADPQQGGEVAWAGLDGEQGYTSADGCSLPVAIDAASALSAVAAAAVAEEQQKRPKQPVLQQMARLTAAPKALLQLPVCFAPQVLRQAAAQLSLVVMPADKQRPAAAKEAQAEGEAEEGQVPARSLLAWGPSRPPAPAAASPPAPNPLVWRYGLTGIARADAPGVRFSVKCIAKQSAEQVLEVPLPGLDVELAAAAAAARPAADQSGDAARGAAGTISGSLGGFRYSLLLSDEHRAALQSAVTLQQLDAVPVPPAAAAKAGSIRMPPAAAAPVLRYMMRFAPQKALNAVVQLQVERGEGGPCWLYDVHLVATAPDVGGVLTLEAHLGCTAELPVHLAASGPDPQPFQAEFTPESPLNFDVVPAVGTLPPLVANTQSCGNSITPAPLKVTFVCKELGKVVTGKLVVVTPDRQETFLVRGKQPAYLPPQPSALPSGAYLTATTASSRAKGSNPAKASPQASSPATSGGLQTNFLIKNIKALHPCGVAVSKAAGS